MISILYEDIIERLIDIIEENYESNLSDRFLLKKLKRGKEFKFLLKAILKYKQKVLRIKRKNGKGYIITI